MQPASDQINNQQQPHSKSFKTKMALFFGYNGQKFQGMQFQRQHTNTIENIVHAVLLNTGFILKTNADQLKKIKWSRGARTDKKVHALCNGITMKLEIHSKYMKQGPNREIQYRKIMKDLNDELPPDIKILAVRKVAKHFDMRQGAKTRIYNYIIPSKMFQPYEQFKDGHKIEGQQLDKTVEQLNQLVKNYLGTHNYYNFTRGYKQTNPQCVRYMIKMSAQIVEAETVKKLLKENQYQSFIRFTLVGQSFIYHQIRKMIGLLVKIFCFELDGVQTIAKAFEPEQYDVFLAPGEGLYLNRLTFESYNNKKDTKEKLQFYEDQQECILDYRSYLEAKILNHELENRVFSEWLKKRIQYKEQQQQEQILDDND